MRGAAAVDWGLEAVCIQRALRDREVGGDAPIRRAGVHLQTDIRISGRFELTFMTALRQMNPLSWVPSPKKLTL